MEQKIIKEEISSHYANTNLSAVRKALYRLKQVSDIDYIFFDVGSFSVSRETDIKKPFTMNERLQILDAIEKGIGESRAILTPYKKSGVGKNPHG